MALSSSVLESSVLMVTLVWLYSVLYGVGHLPLLGLVDHGPWALPEVFSGVIPFPIVVIPVSVVGTGKTMPFLSWCRF